VVRKSSKLMGVSPQRLKSSRPRIRERSWASGERKMTSALELTRQYWPAPPAPFNASVRIGLVRLCQVLRSTGAWQLNTLRDVNTWSGP
jgi:hypothetical protein